MLSVLTQVRALRRYLSSMRTLDALDAKSLSAPFPRPWHAWIPSAIVLAIVLLAMLFYRDAVAAMSAQDLWWIGFALVLTLTLVHAVALLENRRLDTALTTWMTVDLVTALPNNLAMIATIDQKVSRGNRDEQPFALLFVSLDHSQTLDERHGYAAEDTALREFGQIARGILRPLDTLGRWGREGFIILLPQANAAAAATRGEQLRVAVADHQFGEAVRYLTCSIGVATYPEHGADRDTLLAAAEGAMYAARALGRNQVRVTGSPEVAALLADPRGRGWSNTSALSSTVTALSGLDKGREVQTGRHTEAVGELALQLALSLGCIPVEARQIALAGRLHDVGKIAVADTVLQKPGQLTPGEWAQIHRHPMIGAEIVGRIPALQALAPIIRGHHERWDGTGYPDKLIGEQIPLGARIIAVADAYAAMTADRVYQRARPPTVALDELRRCAGKQFDPTVVAALERVLVAAPPPTPN